MSNNPLRPLRYLPWAALFQSAAVTIVIALILDVLVLVVLLGLLRTNALAILPEWFYGNWLLLLPIALPLLVSFGIGALSLWVTRRFFSRRILLSVGTLWALLGCLLVLLQVVTLLRMRTVLVPPVDYASLVGLLFGIFYTGRKYWR